ncbi:MAG: hypothetical protein WBV94_24835 [Blastocatellia bacterium]
MTGAQQTEIPAFVVVRQRECEWCKGHGLMRLLGNGDAVKWDSPEDTNTVAKCYCRWTAADEEAVRR